jgi:hypothetical protein
VPLYDRKLAHATATARSSAAGPAASRQEKISAAIQWSIRAPAGGRSARPSDSCGYSAAGSTAPGRQSLRSRIYRY